MPKPLSSAIGIDLGLHSFKAVKLQRKGRDDQFELQAFASRIVGEAGSLQNTDGLAHHLKLLLKDLGASAKSYAVAVSRPESILRIIEQPPTPTRLLREALRLNGLQLLNQDCREFVLDCDQIPSAATADGANGAARTENFSNDSGGGGRKQLRYLVGGLPRELIGHVYEACAKCRLAVDRLQLAPIANYNAFESALRPTFESGAFMLIDIGHRETRVFAGLRRELLLVRTVEYGGQTFLDAVAHEGTIDREAAITLVEQGDAGMTEAARESLAMLAMELRQSIGFFEGQSDQTIDRVHFSGALVNAEMPLQILSDELEVPCDTWDPFAGCKVALPRGKQVLFDAERAHLNVACGAALELLQSA